MAKDRFLRKLKDQLGFLQRSCEYYDAGAEEEAFRIATTLRILFNDTPRCTSLSKHLGMQGWKMLTSDLGHDDYRGYIAIRLSLSSSTPVRSVPRLGEKFSVLPMYQWWHEQTVFEYNGTRYPRRKVVLAAADKDGGAHVDEKLEAFYEHLAGGTFSLGITGQLEYQGKPPFEQGVTQYAQNTHLALIRQFGHEVLMAAMHFDWFGLLRTATSEMPAHEKPE